MASDLLHWEKTFTFSHAAHHPCCAPPLASRSWGILGHGVLRLLLDPLQGRPPSLQGCLPSLAWALGCARAAWARGLGRRGWQEGTPGLTSWIRSAVGPAIPQPWALVESPWSPSARWAEGGHHTRSSSWLAGAPDSMSPISLPEPSMQPLLPPPSLSHSPSEHPGPSQGLVPVPPGPASAPSHCSSTAHIPIAWPVFSGLFIVSSHSVCGSGYVRVFSCLEHMYARELALPHKAGATLLELSCFFSRLCPLPPRFCQESFPTVPVTVAPHPFVQLERPGSQGCLILYPHPQALGAPPFPCTLVPSLHPLF